MSRWTNSDLAVLRLPITASEMQKLLPGRSTLSIRLRRRRLAQAEGFIPVNPEPDFSAMGRLSGDRRRVIEAEHKARFILAVQEGRRLTQTEVVARSTYRRWRKTDPSFLTWFNKFKAEKVEARERIRAEVRQKREAERSRRLAGKSRGVEARKAPLGEHHRTALLQNDVYKLASEAIGSGQGDIRDASVSAMVLDLLEGTLTPDDCKRHAPKYRAAARAEISSKSFEDKHDAAVSFRLWNEEGSAW